MDPFTEQAITAVGVTLVHFLWQGAAIGVVTAAVLGTCPRAMARTRYGIAGAGLTAIMTAPLVTLGLVRPAAPAINAILPAYSATATAESAAAGTIAMAAVVPWLPAAVAVWAAGVLLLTVRLLFSWWRTERVRRRDVHPAAEGLRRAVRRLSRDLGIRRAVALFESPWVDVPTVIGWLRPTILLPIGALTGLSIQQLEAVLSHELAHIKRHDYLVNVLQNLAETLFFYHPAVWWISKQIRVAREHCCDDVAVEACGNPVMYARALAMLEESRLRQATFALAATAGPLVDRVRRILNPAHADPRRPSLPIAACVVVILAVVAFGGTQAQGQDRPAVAEATQVYPSQFILPVGPSAALAAPAEAPGEMAPDDAPAEENNAGAAETPRVTQQPREPTPQPIPLEPAQIPPPPLPEGAVLRVGGAIRPPVKIRDVRPAYPQAARDAGISGIVILEAVLDPDGVPASIKVLRSIPELDQAAINAVRQWRYLPTLLNGVPVSVMLTATVNFTLQEAPAGPGPTMEQIESSIATLRRLARERTDALGGQVPDGQPDAELTRLARELALMEARLKGLSEPQQASSPQNPVEPNTLILPVGGEIKEPRKIHDVPPIYPRIARAAKVSGVVIVQATIDTEGNVTEATILRSVPMLDNAALDAVRQWKYEPTLVNGVPTSVKMTMTVNFTPN